MVLSKNWVADQEGNYIFNGPASPQQILDLASHIVNESFVRCGEVTTPGDTHQFLIRTLGHREQEVFAAILLDNRHRIISFEELFYGTINGASVHPREVVKVGLFNNAAAVIFAHNHPSGVTEPSNADKALTKRLTEALALVDIRVLDHFIVAGNETTSLAERGLI